MTREGSGETLTRIIYRNRRVQHGESPTGARDVDGRRSPSCHISLLSSSLSSSLLIFPSPSSTPRPTALCHVTHCQYKHRSATHDELARDVVVALAYGHEPHARSWEADESAPEDRGEEFGRGGWDGVAE